MQPGLLAPLLTPFEQDGRVASDLYVAHAHHLLEQGCIGIVPFGTTGEGPSVGLAERTDAVNALVSGGINPNTLLIGTGTTSIVDTIDLTRHAADIGAAGVLVLPPFYFRGASADGVHAYFTELCNAVDIDVYLYHIPQVAGIGFGVDAVKRLVALPNVVGIKDSSGDWENTSALLGIDGLTTYPGSELPLLDALALGAPGCISATANVNAGAIAATIDAWLSGDTAGAAHLHEGVTAVRLALQARSPIPAQKALLAHTTGDERWTSVRTPWKPLDRHELDSLLSDLDAAGWTPPQ